MDVICKEGLDRHLILGDNYSKRTNMFVSSRANKGPMKDASHMAIADDEVIVDYPNYAHLSGTTSQDNTVEPNAHPVLEGNSNLEGNAHPVLEGNSNLEGNVKKQKAHRRKKPAMASKPGPKTYPLSNQSLISTGIFDGAPVKYILRRRDIILHGVIKGSKILCSCSECNNSKYVSPSKFERHAGGKTKKPYACIYLQNGKTIDQVLRELKATLKDVLFHRLPKTIDFAYNWLSCNNWESYSILSSSPAAHPPIKMSHFNSSQ